MARQRTSFLFFFAVLSISQLNFCAVQAQAPEAGIQPISAEEAMDLPAPPPPPFEETAVSPIGLASGAVAAELGPIPPAAPDTTAAADATQPPSMEADTIPSPTPEDVTEVAALQPPRDEPAEPTQEQVAIESTTSGPAPVPAPEPVTTPPPTPPVLAAPVTITEDPLPAEEEEEEEAAEPAPAPAPAPSEAPPVAVSGPREVAISGPRDRAPDTESATTIAQAG
ncbi:hypothetical protein Ndes2526B_g05196 [Nannochloris sp. 'desiccata']|nr:hypothetical protein KSW81_000119 [Chlorella desiccata (nom. nud.)]KAH7619950.1 hypothetical protein NADE_008227 [Chlorella desiccata (nom. nud.)]